MTADTTLLKTLIKQQHLKYETFCREYEEVALQVAPDDIPPSKAQYYRWLSGQLKDGVPYPNACRVLEAMFPPWTITDLFGPYVPTQHAVVNAESPTTKDSVTNILDSVTHSLSADTLQGAWVTSFYFDHDQTSQCHVDITHVEAQSDYLVSATNYPPMPRSEGRSSPFRNKIEARLANRHLIGDWKNINDARYFGSLHLAILPGETVIEGYYTGFASDVQVSSGYWKWVRIKPESFADVTLSEVDLRTPSTLYDIVRNHSRNDAPLTLTDIIEET